MAQPIRYLSTYGQFTNLNPLTYQDKFSTYPVDSAQLLFTPVVGQVGVLVFDTIVNKYRFFITDEEYRTFMRGG